MIYTGTYKYVQSTSWYEYVQSTSWYEKVYTSITPALQHCLATKQPFTKLVHIKMEVLIAFEDRIFHKNSEFEILISISRTVLQVEALNAIIIHSFGPLLM
jgi:hypothetical protein